MYIISNWLTLLLCITTSGNSLSEDFGKNREEWRMFCYMTTYSGTGINKRWRGWWCNTDTYVSSQRVLGLVFSQDMKHTKQILRSDSNQLQLLATLSELRQLSFCKEIFTEWVFILSFWHERTKCSSNFWVQLGYSAKETYVMSKTAFEEDNTYGWFHPLRMIILQGWHLHTVISFIHQHSRIMNHKAITAVISIWF